MTSTQSARVVRQFYAGSGINAFGSGVYLTAGVIFLVRTTGLTVSEVGVWMTAGALVGTGASVVIGAAADRVGVLRTIKLTYVVQAIGMLLLTTATSPFVAGGLVLFFLGQRSTNGLAATASAALGTPTTRVAIRATSRAVSNGGIAAGSVVAGVVLGTGEDWLLRAVPAVNAISFVLAALLLPRKAERTERQREARQPLRRDALPSRRFLLLAVANAASMLHFDVQAILLPLWILAYTEAVPVWAVGYAFAVNTALIVIGQRWHATRMEAAGSRRRAAAVSGMLMMGAFVCYATLATVHETSTSLFILTIGVGLHSAGEIMQANAFGAASLDLAEPKWQGFQQSLFYLVAGGLRSLAPAALTSLLVVSPNAGWLLLAGAVVIAGVAGARLIPAHSPIHRSEVSTSAA